MTYASTMHRRFSWQSEGSATAGFAVSYSSTFVAECFYNAFGNVTYQNSYINNFRYCFSTKYFDTETCLYYYDRRFYDPLWGRWLNLDPIEGKGGLNLYAFCGNDGVNAVDLLSEWRVEYKEESTFEEKKQV